ARPGGLVLAGVVAAARPAAGASVPVGGRRGRRALVRRHRGRLDRHRGRPAAVDRVRDRAHRRRRHDLGEHLGELHGGRRRVRGDRHRHDPGAAGHVPALAAARRRRGDRAVRATGAGGGGLRRDGCRAHHRRRGRAVTAADGVAVVLLVGVTLYAWTGVADFGAGFWDLVAGGRERGARPRALIDA